MQDIIERYLDCWNETDPAARRKLVEQVWAPDASYTDPLAEVAGRDAIEATIAAVQGQFPGYVFTLAGPVDAHHRQARFSWNLAPAGEEPVVVGSDVALAGPDGQLTAVFGFLDQVPAV
ncbi:MAG: nuclear transport factor 2 family protein [Actinobacteria bacterium]|nr:nuclear transport factor 2 family protein [Actinomycetota bacterium]